jgi:hypothetical protein
MATILEEAIIIREAAVMVADTAAVIQVTGYVTFFQVFEF